MQLSSAIVFYVDLLINKYEPIWQNISLEASSDTQMTIKAHGPLVFMKVKENFISTVSYEN